ncbi:MAG: hypothetical protein JSU86_18805 [Phycisphaerales bacterium]|nr:MAG: hypothetical protein JSU86_18805 [Phycisphaerales bacterium]
MRHTLITRPAVFVLLALAGLVATASADRPRNHATSADEPPAPTPIHREMPDDPPVPRSVILRSRTTSPARVWVRGAYSSIQVNVDTFGNNIIGDAANEPSLAVDPTNPSRIAIGWRQFDTITSNFRQAGWAYSHDAGQTWTFPGVLEPYEFGSDPVLDFDADGRFYYYSLQPYRGPGEWACYMYRSDDGGVTWPQETYAWGGDKGWFTIDRTDGIGRGNIYCAWSINAACCGPLVFNRSTNGGQIFSYPIGIPQSPRFGTLTVGPAGELYVVGYSGTFDNFIVARSTNAQDPLAIPVWDQVTSVDLGGSLAMSTGPNPAGLLGQLWIASDHSNGLYHGNLYVLGSVDPAGYDPLDIHFARSTNGGLTWSEPVRVNDDATDNGAWQWFGTMSVAPNGRIDVIWNDTRGDVSGRFSELYYSFSLDGGLTWAENVPLSQPFDHHLGYPEQDKLGDYYDMVSENFGVGIAYAATFNLEQDVYYLRIGGFDCNGNEIPDSEDLAQGTSDDCNENDIPDECDPDCNDNDLVDECETRDGVTDDCNNNLVPDECDPDFDGDGSIDECDPDIDDDGVPNDVDECDFTPSGVPITPTGRTWGDFDGSCVIDLGDFWPRLFTCLDNGGPGVPLSPIWCTNWFDYDNPAEHDIDLRDFAAFQRLFGR